MKPKNREAATYVVKSCIIAMLFYVLFSYLPVERVTSDFTAQVLNSFGISAESYEEAGRIYLEYLQISIDCTALEIMAIFLGLILAAKSTLTKRVLFSLFTFFCVFFANIARISIVYYLLEKGIPWYLAHDLFSGGLSIAAGIAFLMLSEHYLPQINENLYTLLDAAETRLNLRKR
ncbi:MAG: exosortase/archaeosortase family protein [Theionarchaea archaeon]|nr:exosortase/archaeosortase family protein [Theionarchaea archaeon]